MEYKVIEGGGITSPKGFTAGAVYVGVKSRKTQKPDVAVLYSETEASCAAVFTTNKFCAAPVILDREILKNGKARAIVINSGNANAATGITYKLILTILCIATSCHILICHKSFAYHSRSYICSLHNYVPLLLSLYFLSFISYLSILYYYKEFYLQIQYLSFGFYVFLLHIISQINKSGYNFH